ncbi:MAG: hypothetical protein LR015_07635 [Verrucomicrobia bacterium]|nr:hypothetical protein [Verrucomicrobiota bacterium]
MKTDGDHTSGTNYSITAWYLGSVLLEKNRWRRNEPPQLTLSQFTHKLLAAGFNELELWEFHYLKAHQEEQRSLCEGPLAFPIFNTYAEFRRGAEYADRLEQVRAAVLALGSKEIKFNVPKEPELLEDALAIASDWIETFPQGIRLLCECHPGTALEEPDVAARVIPSLPQSRFGTIAHVMASPTAAVRTWFEALGNSLSHIHIQTRDDTKKFCLAADRKEWAQEAIGVLQEFGFKGSITCEFTKGCATPEETPDELLAAAVADRNYLQNLWLPRN